MTTKLIVVTQNHLQELGRGVKTDRAEYLLAGIKSNGRNPAVSKALTTHDLDLIVDRYLVSKKNTSPITLHDALTILANALVLNRALHDSWDPRKAVSRVINECFQPDVTSFQLRLYLRLLFLFTFHGLDFDPKVVKSFVAIVSSQITRLSLSGAQFDDEADRLAFIECLKVAFNLLHFYSSHSLQFVGGRTSHDLVRIYFSLDPADQENVPIFQHISNCLLCFPVHTWLYDDPQVSESIMEKILDFVEKMVNPRNSTLREDRFLSPSLSLVHSIVSDLFSPKDEDLNELRTYVRDRILPSDEDRQLPLGKSNSLSSHLLQITIDPVLRTSRNIIFDIFWKVSDESAEKFVQNFGLGFASSFLASQGIAFPESLTTDESSIGSSASSTVSDAGNRKSSSGSSTLSNHRRSLINPVTGQFLDHEKKQYAQRGIEEMTQEEKERDAERMFVLFERLNKTNGPLKVANPVAVAQHEGRLEHINDDDDSDDSER